MRCGADSAELSGSATRGPARRQLRSALQPRTRQQRSWRYVKMGATMVGKIFWKVGVLGDYRNEFWKFALRRLARGEIEYFISSMMVAHHLILFSREASQVHANASAYSIKLQEASVPAE